MKMKYSGFFAALLVVSLCACNTGKSDKDINPTQAEITKTPETDEGKNTPTPSTEEAGPEKEPAADKSEEAPSENDYPGAYVVELVNLRGDKTTVYKLVDGTYLDRIERHFTYNGTDTWTDEDGVEWNEAVNGEDN